MQGDPVAADQGGLDFLARDRGPAAPQVMLQDGGKSRLAGAEEALAACVAGEFLAGEAEEFAGPQCHENVAARDDAVGKIAPYSAMPRPVRSLSRSSPLLPHLGGAG